jgi:Cu-Zn family superoxide dismutase
MNLRLPLLSFASLAVLGACSVPAPTQWPGLPYVVASLQPIGGSQASGTVYFIQKGPQVLVRGHVTGLKPNQEHAFHVHEKGDCSGADGMTAGAHLNPDGKPHGRPGGEHHAGDLPAITADASGAAEVRLAVNATVLGGGPGDFAGKAVIVHAGPDDYTTQPMGNAGARIACGVIGSVTGQDGLGRPVALPIDL